MKLRIVLASFILIGGIVNQAFAQEEPQTVAEQSNFQATSLSSQVVEFVDWCDEKAPHVSRYDFGKTVEGRPLVATIIADPPYTVGEPDDRLRILAIGNIHSGECAAKEALLMMVREFTHQGDHPWLKKAVLVIAPNYNADGNDRLGAENRPGQIGPDKGMGMRENAQHLDLNRDFMKLESPEAQSLVKLIDAVNPHLFIDGHTTNGSRHQYALTYDIPHNPAVPEPIRNYLRGKFMPTVTESMEQTHGLLTFYYGNLNREKTAWRSFGHEPRYSTEYVGLRGRLAILSEAYSYISYEKRIAATKAFMESCMGNAVANADTIKTLLDEVEKEHVKMASEAPQRIQVSMNAKVERFDEKVTVKAFQDDEPHDFSVDFVAKYASTRSVALPFAYIIPQRFARVAERLRMHGVTLEQLAADQTLTVSVDTIQDIAKRNNVFPGRSVVKLDVTRELAKRSFMQGDYVVRTSQPLGRLIAALLEPSSDDGFAFWNFFDSELSQDGDFPVFGISAAGELATEAMPKSPSGRNLTFADIDGPNNLLSKTPRAPKWIPDSSNYVMSRWGRDYKVDPETGGFAGVVEPRALPTDFIPPLKKLLGDQGSDELVAKIASRKLLESKKGRYQIYTGEGRVFVFDTSDDMVIELENADTESELFEFTDDETHLLYIEDKKLVIRDVRNLLDKQFDIETTKDREEFDHYGKLDWVYQEELYGRGNFKGFWLNQKTKRVAVLMLQEKEVGKYTVLDHIPWRGESEVTAYPKAGDPIPDAKLDFLLVRDGFDKEQRMTKLFDQDYELISNVSWSPDGNRLYVQVQNREQTELQLVAFDFPTDDPIVDHNPKSVTTLIEEKTDGWIESYGTPNVLKDGSFLWLSARTGFTHLYHYESDGKIRKTLTSGEWEIRNLIGIDPNEKFAFFTATREDAFNVHGYRVEIETGEVKQITMGDGNHSLDFCDDYSYFFDSVSTFTEPNRVFVCKSDGTRLREVKTSSDDRFEHINFGETEFLEVPAADGHPLDAVIIRPPNFDPTKKYPVLYHIYAGPQAPRVNNRFGGKFYLWHQMMAQKGYVVWMCDNRSASYRGKKPMWETHRDLGRNELADIESSVAWLKKQPWVDSERIGIWGWSYGGYMTAYAMTHSKSFKMGISGAPVTDWRNYDAIYTERLMGLPQDNPEGYESSSVLNAAGDLSGKLLLIHGTMDDNVHISNSMQFIYELQKAGKQFDFMVYPRNRHSVRNPEQIGHMRQLMTDFVLENL